MCAKNLVIAQTTLLCEEHFGMIVQANRWLAMRTDVSEQTFVNHLSNRGRCVE